MILERKQFAEVLQQLQKILHELCILTNWSNCNCGGIEFYEMKPVDVMIANNYSELLK
jgi:hypothetical protein